MKQIFIASFMSLLLIACANKSDVKFMGENIDIPCQSFTNHLESKGFHKDGNTYKGKYLGEDVFIMLLGEVNGHYSKILVSSVFASTSDYNPILGKAKQYYKKVCREIKKEHSGFEEEEDNSADVLSKEYYNEQGGSIKISFFVITLAKNSTTT